LDSAHVFLLNRVCRTGSVIAGRKYCCGGAQIVEFALRQKIALFAPFREDADAGALMAFGINLDGQWRLGASYVQKIMMGAKPDELPVQQPIKFEMVVNLKTAKAIGVEVPTSLLLSADRVIE
jgi:putative ABC transport system substrate-binding protein